VLDKVDAGEEVIIHRGKEKSYMIIPIHDNDIEISEEFRQKLLQAREDYKNGKGVACRTFEDSMALFDSL